MKLCTTGTFATIFFLVQTPLLVAGQRSCKFRLRVDDVYNEKTGGSGWRWTGDTYCVERDSSSVPGVDVIWNNELSSSHDFKGSPYNDDQAKIKNYGKCRNTPCENRSFADGCSGGFVETITKNGYDYSIYDCGFTSYRRDRQLRGGLTDFDYEVTEPEDDNDSDHKADELDG